MTRRFRLDSAPLQSTSMSAVNRMTDIQSSRFGQSPNMSTNVTKTFFPSLQHRRCHLSANRRIRSEAHSELAVRRRRRNRRTLFQSPKDSVEGTDMHPAIRCCFPSNVAARTSQKRQVHPIPNHHCRWIARDFQARLLPDRDSSSQFSKWKRAS
jgi:hypothetical protein